MANPPPDIPLSPAQRLNERLVLATLVLAPLTYFTIVRFPTEGTEVDPFGLLMLAGMSPGILLGVWMVTRVGRRERLSALAAGGFAGGVVGLAGAFLLVWLNRAADQRAPSLIDFHTTGTEHTERTQARRPSTVFVATQHHLTARVPGEFQAGDYSMQVHQGALGVRWAERPTPVSSLP